MCIFTEHVLNVPLSEINSLRKDHNMIHQLNVYVSNLAVLNVKFHNLHWNVVGPQFIALHQFSESVYDGFFKSYDAIAELIKMRKAFPVGNLKTVLALTTITELEDASVTTVEMLSIMKDDFTQMIALATAIRQEADALSDFSVVAVMESEIATYEKHLWFISSMQS